MEFNKDYIRTQSGTLISALTGRRYSDGQEAQLIKDNERITTAANLRAQAAGEPNPTPRQIRTGEFGDSRSVTMRVADAIAAKNPRSATNPYSAALQLNLAKQANANFQSPELVADAERLKAKEAEYETRRQKLATIPHTEPAPVDDLRTAADALRSAPKQVGEGDWRKAAADAIDRKADERDAEQRAADTEQARLNNDFVKKTFLCANAQLRELEGRGDVEQAWINEARQHVADLMENKLDPAEFWAVHQPQHVERMTAVMGKHKADISRKQAELDAYEEQAREGTVAPPAEPPAPAPEAAP
jgi:hypothetical protein